MLPLDTSIAINIFFHNFDKSVYANGKDLYGNKDLECYTQGRDKLEAVMKVFDNHHPSIRKFYLARLGQELLDIAAQRSH